MADVTERKKKRDNSLKRLWQNLGVQQRLLVVMNAGLLVAVFFMGYFYGQLQVLRGGDRGKLPVEGGVDQPSVQQPEKAGPLSEEVWRELVQNPVAVQGNENAKVILVEFTDYQCPYCKRYFDDSAGKIIEKYVKTGKVKYVLRDLPLSFHANAEPAAQAARCAGDQGKYWEMHEVLFEKQGEWSNGEPVAKFSSYAREIGIDVSTFDSCVRSGKHAEAVAADVALATKAGASATPYFYINGKPVIGAQPFSAFEAVIEAEL